MHNMWCINYFYSFFFWLAFGCRRNTESPRKYRERIQPYNTNMICARHTHLRNFWKAKSVSCKGSQPGSCKNCFSTSASKLRLVGGSPFGSWWGKYITWQYYMKPVELAMTHRNNHQYLPCFAVGKAILGRDVWWVQTCQSIPSPARTEEGPQGPEAAHLQRNRSKQRHAMATRQEQERWPVQHKYDRGNIFFL